MREFLSTVYGQVVAIAGVIATFWGIFKAVGALKKWFSATGFWKKHVEKKSMSKQIMDMLTELKEEMEAQGKRLENNEAAIIKLQESIEEVAANLHNNNEATASLMLERMMSAYDYYVKKGHKIPLMIRTSLIEINKQYTTYDYRNHVPHDFEEKIMSCDLE